MFLFSPPLRVFFSGLEAKQGLVSRLGKMRKGSEGTTERNRGLVSGVGGCVWVLSYLLGMIKMEKRAVTISVIGT